MHVSKKNQPVVDRLIMLLSQSEYVADAIADNSLDDRHPLDPEIVINLKCSLVKIADALDIAEQADLKDLSEE